MLGVDRNQSGACISCGRVAAGRKKNNGEIAIFGAKGSVCTECGNDEFSVLG